MLRPTPSKGKKPTPQEIYKERKEREGAEKDALLPPGLINHGNTCFMNSTLQGLIATRFLHDLYHFTPLPPAAQTFAPRPILSQRSPSLTNGHELGGEFEQKWEEGMPLSDAFLAIMHKAWTMQDAQARQSMSPKDILTAIGRKYDQYLDFRQQDAHEFLRQLLDAMRMEEFDIIKKRQPPPPRRRKKRSVAALSPVDEASASASTSEVKLESLSDMLFGGQLTSVLVCEKCKHVSHTYEDFNDLSLSIKPEDYAREKKRDRIKKLATRLKLGRSDPGAGADIVRAASVPPSPVRRSADLASEPAQPSRRRSIEVLTPTVENEEGYAQVEMRLTDLLARADESAVEDEVGIALEAVDAAPQADEKKLREHVEFTEAQKPEKREKEKEKDDGWAKLGRRISMSVGLGRSKERSRSRDRGRRVSMDAKMLASPVPISAASSEAGRSRELSPEPSPKRAGASPRTSSAEPRAGASSPPPRPDIKRLSSSLAAALTGDKPKRVEKRPKPSREESAYLRRILADVGGPSANPFALFRAGEGVPAASAQSLWTKLAQLTTIEECLRLFTSVEVLDGENMVGCHRCWKIEHGLWKPRPCEPETSSSSESEADAAESEKEEKESDAEYVQVHHPELPPPAPSPDLVSISSSTSLNLSDATSMTSLSTPPSSTALDKPFPILSPSSSLSRPGTPGGLPIPVISTTAPDSPLTSPLTAKPSPSSSGTGDLRHLILRASGSRDSLRAPGTRRRKRAGDESEEQSEEDSDTSDESNSTAGYSSASSLASSSQERQRRRRADGTVIPRAQQVILRRSYKRYLVATPPPILVIHLKRFQQTSKTPALAFSSGFKKLDDFVAFPEHLDLTPFLAPRKEEFAEGRSGKGKGKETAAAPSSSRAGSKEKPERCVYRLYAVVQHLGNMLGGHYVAYVALPPRKADPATPSDPPVSPDGEAPAHKEKARESEDNKKPAPAARQWAYVSDTIVKLTTLDEVLKAKAYLCMYERV